MNKENSMFSGMMDILNEHARKKKELLEKLEQLPSEKITISKQELEMMQNITIVLNDCLKKIEEQRVMHERNPQLFPPVPRGGEEEQNVLASMINTLDKYNNFWLCKFSTESQGTGEDLAETPNDSIYYMTHSGASLRFKMANLEKGLEKVVQPFAEFMYFSNPENGVSETPKLGYFTEEYFTKELEKEISVKELPQGDYQSSIKKYYLDGKFVAAPDTDKVTFHHNGSPVNKIFFENKK